MADLLTNLDFANTAAAVITQNTAKYVGWGTSTGATAASTNVAVPAAPTTTTAVTGTMSNVTTTVTNDTVQVDATVTATGAVTVTEAGVFKSATMAGNMVQYTSWAGATLASGDSIAFTFKKKYA